MAEENISRKFRLENTDKTRNCLIKDIDRNELIGKKNKKFCTSLNYIKHFLILGSTITGCVSISALLSLAGISIGITSFAVGLKMCAINSAIKR